MSRIQTENRAHFRAILMDTFQPAIFLSQWSCTAPYPLDPYQRATRNYQAKCSRPVALFRRTLSLLLFTVILAAPFLLYHLYSGQIYAYTIPLSVKLMYYVQTAIQTSTMGYILLVYQFRTNFHRFYFDRLVGVLEQFGQTDIDIRLGALQTNIRRLLPIIPLHIALVLAAYILHDQSWGVLAKIVIFLATQLMATSLTLLYLTIFGTVSVLLRQMNDTLEGILVLPISDPNTDKSAAYFTTPVRLTRDDDRTIEKIRLLQLQLLQIVRRTNGGEYGRLVIMILLATFIYLNTELLQLYQGVKAGAFTFDVIGSKVLNSAQKILMLFLFAYPNRMIQTQNIRGLKLLYQLNQPGNDSRSNEITNRFITQTTLFLEKAHEAYGMISIDMTLILSIVGGLTNILVVLVQFADAKPSPN
uniref:Gustatory receptor n=1 Tax=Anopheles coluzzii TaxID=1518534 RepID=A0A6E8VQX7_ANOCL